MKRIAVIVIAMAMATASAHAGFKMYGPGGQHMTSSETEAERVEREAREAAHRQVVEEYRQSITPQPVEKPPRPRRKNPLSVEDVEKGKPPIIDDGPRPGGHRRHIWREQTGFSTPAARTRYIKEMRRQKLEAQKERERQDKIHNRPAPTSTKQTKPKN